MTNLRKDFETKLSQARCAAENGADVNAGLQKSKNDLIAQVKDEEAAQKRAEQDAEKLRLTLRFERDLHRQELKEVYKQSKIKNQSNQIQISKKYKAQMNDALSTLRGQLEDQLRLNHMNFDNQMKTLQGPVMGTDVGGSAAASIVAAQAPLISTKTQIATLQSQVLKCQSSICSLELQIKYWEKVLANDKSQMDNLQRSIQELCRKYQKLLDDKVKIQGELDAYNGILQAEENRLQLADMCGDPVEKEGNSDSNSKQYSVEIEYYPNQWDNECIN